MRCHLTQLGWREFLFFSISNLHMLEGPLHRVTGRLVSVLACRTLQYSFRLSFVRAQPLRILSTFLTSCKSYIILVFIGRWKCVLRSLRINAHMRRLVNCGMPKLGQTWQDNTIFAWVIQEMHKKYTRFISIYMKFIYKQSISHFHSIKYFFFLSSQQIIAIRDNSTWTFEAQIHLISKALQYISSPSHKHVNEFKIDEKISRLPLVVAAKPHKKSSRPQATSSRINL